MIDRSLRVIEQFTGKRPVGWLGPGLTQTNDTPDYLAAAGIKYIADWVYDDEPTKIETLHGSLVTLPFSVECNDITVMVVQNHEAGYWKQKCLDTFNRLYKESEHRPKFMTIVVHPFITAQPFRIEYHEQIYEHIAAKPGVLNWNGEQILDWYLKATADSRILPDQRSIMAAESVGMIGLGIMGSAMSTNLIRAGFKVVGFDVLAPRRHALRKAGGTPAKTCEEVAQELRHIS